MIDWWAIKLFLSGWCVGGLFWIPLTILMMRVLVQMGVTKGFGHDALWRKIAQRIVRFVLKPFLEDNV